MDASAVTQMITNLGFPIACVVALFWEWNKERENHKEEMEKLTAALNNNTEALIKIEEFIRNALKS